MPSLFAIACNNWFFFLELKYSFASAKVPNAHPNAIPIWTYTLLKREVTDVEEVELEEEEEEVEGFDGVVDVLEDEVLDGVEGVLFDDDDDAGGVVVVLLYWLQFVLWFKLTAPDWPGIVTVAVSTQDKKE